MKALILFIFASTSLWAGEIQKPSDIVANQIKVTHNSLQQVLVKMRNTPTTSTQFTHPDFVVASKRFNEKAEAAILEFENTLRKDILSEVDFYIKRLNDIQNSNSYTDSQKAEIQKNQIGVAEVAFKKYSKMYQDALVKLYSVDLPEAQATITGRGYPCASSRDREINVIFKNPDFKLSDNRNYRLILSRNCNPDGKDETQPLPIDIYVYNLDGGSSYDQHSYEKEFESKIRNFVVQEAILRNCLTAGCASLMSELRKNFVTLVASELEKPISFKLYNSKNELIANLDLVANPIVYQHYGDRRRAFSSDQLKKYFDLVVEDTINLPFDISQAEFDRIQKDKLDKEREARANQLAPIIAELIDDSWTYGVFRDWKCPAAEIKQLRTDFCNSQLMGCITSEESTRVVDAIKAKFAKSEVVAERTNCFQESVK